MAFLHSLNQSGLLLKDTMDPPFKSRFMFNLIVDGILGSINNIRFFYFFQWKPAGGAVFPFNLKFPSRRCLFHYLFSCTFIKSVLIGFVNCYLTFPMADNFLEQPVLIALGINLRKQVFSNDIVRNVFLFTIRELYNKNPGV
jgi:hypothetical protein